jgi:hypothetical protein
MRRKSRIESLEVEIMDLRKEIERVDFVLTNPQKFNKGDTVTFRQREDDPNQIRGVISSSRVEYEHHPHIMYYHLWVRRYTIIVDCIGVYSNVLEENITKS